QYRSGRVITVNGLYTAPAVAGSYTITAVSNADNTKSASALVVVPQPEAVTISPANASVTEMLQFTATVSELSKQSRRLGRHQNDHADRPVYRSEGDRNRRHHRDQSKRQHEVCLPHSGR